MNKIIDLIGIGDITAEPFIRIKDAEANCDINGEHCKISFKFGEKIPYESAEMTYAVGNSPNVVTGVSKLGFNTSLISYMGDDDISKKNIESLLQNNVNIDLIKIVPEMKSNFHYVLWYENERTILVKHNDYPYKFDNEVPESKYVYLSSLSENSIDYHLEIYNYLSKFPNTKLLFQPGTFQIKLGYENIKYIYERTDILFCNVSEAKRILKTEENDKISLLEKLKELGPNIVIITDGINGAYSYDGELVYFVPIYKSDELKSIESTGAGDAFASGVISGLLNGEEFKNALLWGPINSMSVVSKVGAQAGLLDKDTLSYYLDKKEESYKVKIID